MDPSFQDRSQRRSANSGGTSATYATGGTVSSGALFAKPETYGCQLIPLCGASQPKAARPARVVQGSYTLALGATTSHTWGNCWSLTLGPVELTGARTQDIDDDGCTGVSARV